MRTIFSTRFDKIIGIELVHGLYLLSLQAKAAWDHHFENDSNASMIHFIHGSITDRAIDWSDGDVIFANSTCFSDSLMDELNTAGARLKRGTLFVTLTKTLSKRSGFRLIGELRLPASWGEADYYIHRAV
jgi:hypothetical protein